MNIENVITYTRYSESYKAHIESTIWIARHYRLTYTGAQRVIRKLLQAGPEAIVTRVQYMIRSKQ